MRIRFGAFVLDEEARQLERGGHPVHLTPKALELLELLIERRPNAVTKAEIHDRLWPSTFVADVNLPVLVHELREALEDDPHEPHFVRTVTRFGYAFCGSARPEPEAPEWALDGPFEYRLIWGVREIALQPGDNLLGRTHDATIWVDRLERVAAARSAACRRGRGDARGLRQQERDLPRGRPGRRGRPAAGRGPDPPRRRAAGVPVLRPGHGVDGIRRGRARTAPLVDAPEDAGPPHSHV